MKAGTVKFYLKASLQVGLVVAVLYGALALSRAKPGSWETVATNSALLGITIGLFCGALITAVALNAMDYEELDPADVGWLSMRTWTQVELPLGVAESLVLVEEVIRAQKGVIRVEHDPSGRRLTAWTRTDYIMSFGEVIKVQLASKAESPVAATRATIDSRTRATVSLIDFGRSRALVNAIALGLNQGVNRRLEAQREAAHAAALQAQLHQSRLALLQAQVEPHFLYNTLAHLQLLIRSDPARADGMAGDLIRYLRLSMPEFRAAGFTLGRELELVRAYLDIMKIRLRERLEVEIDADEGAAAMPFPPLLLHTLVENAIKHGIEPKPEGGRISIAARHRRNGEDRLVIAVADTGRGLASGLEGSGVGLANLRERLELVYPGRARFSIAGNSPSGVVATLDMPCEEPA